MSATPNAATQPFVRTNPLFYPKRTMRDNRFADRITGIDAGFGRKMQISSN
jgi:hypothetical protein